MGFGSLVRSLSSSGRHSDRNYERSRPVSTTYGDRRGSRAQDSGYHSTRHSSRRHSVQAGAVSADQAAEIYYRAKQVYEQEEEAIQREELRQRTLNDKECKRQMQMIEVNKQRDTKKLETSYNVAWAHNKKSYNYGDISKAEYDRTVRKLEKFLVERSREIFKKHSEEQSKAQRIFFARGEDLCADAGAQLRLAKQKMQRAQRVQMR